MTNNELLLALSDLIENNVIPRLITIESCYTSTYYRYQTYVDKMKSNFADIDIMKKVIAEHDEKLKEIS